MIRVHLKFPYLLIYFLLFVLLDTFQADNIAIFWGQDSDEGSLGEICATGKYSYVHITGLYAYGNNQPPVIELTGHCEAFPCSSVSSDIGNCQKQGISVMLSVLIQVNMPSEDAKVFSEYVWNNFLGGNSSSRPFGDAILDGINFVTGIYSMSWSWVDLARYLKSYHTKKIIYFSASIICGFNNYGKSTINSGLLDYIMVLFMMDPSCYYNNSNPTNLMRSWNQWTKLKVGKIFLGLPTSPDMGPGYVPIDLLNSQILPVIRKSSNYGGIFLYSKDYDTLTAYSESIISPLCQHQNPPQCSGRDDTNFTESFGYMSMASFRVNESEVISHRCCEVICRNNCSCIAYAPTNSTTNTGCQIWSKDSSFNRSLGSNGQKFYVLDKGGQEHRSVRSMKSHKVTWIITGVGAALAISFIYCLSCAFWGNYKEKVNTTNRQKKLIHDIGGTTMVMNYTTNEIKQEENTRNELEIFSFESMAAATDNFSASSKLGEGGYGPVYMGRFTNQQEIAVKRLSRCSGQGLIEFRNEAKLIAKLQHTNLVRLLGFCIQREERMLVYEYMSNRSLDFHLFDAERRKVLDWKKRLNIIEGIAQGLLYLHKYSRLKVIHRDLKASNILLDDEMKPKISDFGMARILGLNGSEENTSRIVGTYGYMSPEYAYNGVVSTKIDIFSFGVLLLEILSGKKNNCYHDPDISLNLIGYAWKLWNEGRGLELMDPGLNETCTPNEVLRCMQIGLLCVQDHAKDRPTMFDVVTFFSNDAIQLAQPKQPAFSINVDTKNSEFSGNIQERDSINTVSVSMDGR